MDAAVERGVGGDHLLELQDRDEGWTATASTPSTSPPCGPTGGGTDQHAALGVLDELDHSGVARQVDPAPSCGGNTGETRPDLEPTVLGLRLGVADRPIHPVRDAQPGIRIEVANLLVDADRGQTQTGQDAFGRLDDVDVGPERAKAWAISSPMAPPPSTIIDSGASATWTMSRLVHIGV